MFKRIKNGGVFITLPTMVAGLFTVPVTVITMTAAATPAIANDNGSVYDDTHGGVGQTPVGGGNGSYNGASSCTAGKDLYIPGKGITYNNYARCNNSNATQRNIWKLCPVGFQVFRFYGNVERPADAWTMSYLNTEQWCNTTAATNYSFWSTSGLDSRGLATANNYGEILPNDKAVRFTGTNAQYVQSLKNVDSRARSLDFRFAPVWKSRGAAQQYSAGRSINGNNYCTRIENGYQNNAKNPYYEYLTSPTASEASKDKIREMLWKAFLDIAGKPNAQGKLPYVEEAKKELGVSSIVKQSSGKINIQFDTSLCSSPMRFVSTQNANLNSYNAQKREDRYTAVCYIPLDRVARIWQVGNNSNFHTFPTMLAPGGVGGLRYADTYKGSKYTVSDPRGTDGNRRANETERFILGSYRKVMYNWYTNSTKMNANNLYKNGQQYIPANPYKVKTGTRNPSTANPGVDLNAARANLRDNARCRFGSKYAFTAKTTTTERVTSATATAGIMIHNNQVYQAGGNRGVTQNVAVSKAQMNCTVTMANGRKVSSAAACDTVDAQYTEFDFDVSIKGTGDFKQCTYKNEAGCDFYYDPALLKATYVKGVRNDVTVPVTFYNPTMNSDKLQVDVTNVQGKFSYRQDNGREVSFDMVNPVTGEKIHSDTVNVDSAQNLFGTLGGVTAISEPGDGVKGHEHKTLQRLNNNSWRFASPVIGAVTQNR